MCCNSAEETLRCKQERTDGPHKYIQRVALKFVRSIAHAMEGKEAHPMTTFCFEYTFCLLQHMVLSLMPVFFIVISVQGISLSRLKGKVC